MRRKVLIAIALVIVSVMVFAGCDAKPGIPSYTIPLVDLSENVIKTGGVSGKTEIAYEIGDETLADPKYADMFGDGTIVADVSHYGKDYMAHPDSILLRRGKDNGKLAFSETEPEILTMFPLGHGKGELRGKISKDAGKTYTEELVTPKSFDTSRETPTLYRLTFSEDNVPNDNDMLIMIAGSPSWHNDDVAANGFNVSLSAPSKQGADNVEGRVWTEFENWYGISGTTISKECNVEYKRATQGTLVGAYDAIVAMSSLTRLKDSDGKWTNEWMGLFHDHQFNCYKTILSFDTNIPADNKYPVYKVNGVDAIMQWSKPVKYFDEFRGIELKSSMCEVECIRHEDPVNGDTLALLTRSNSKKLNSLIIFSTDEGKTWSAPRELPYALSGERHKAEWVEVNGETKLFITFRSIERSAEKVNKYASGSTWMSEGWVAWVGDWQDLVDGTEGDFRVKIAHTYLDGQKGPGRSANADTGYAGNVVLPGTSKVVTCSYGRFSPENSARGKNTYIISKTIDVAALYDLVAMIPAPEEKPGK